MKSLPLISFAFFILISSITVISGPGCANIMPPQGGFRDSIPAMLVKATPDDSSVNFKGNRITLTFDEFINLENWHENLIMSPVPQSDPGVETKLRTIVIRLRDSLQPNTTYTLNFGNAIKDVNEGNITKNLTYMFSTGPVFDSLTLSGQVFLAQNGKVDTTLVVMLHKQGDDSAVVNKRPNYITRIDSTGRFHFRNLPADTFHIYALKNEGGAYRYTSEKTLFAFADSAVIPSTAGHPITLYAYAEEAASTNNRPVPSLGGNRPKIGNTDKRLRVQTNVVGGQMDLLNDLTLSFDQPLKSLDTSLIHFSTDTLFTPVTGYKLVEDTSGKKITMQYKWKENTRYNLILDKDFAEDSLERKLFKTDTIFFNTKKLSDYGSLRLRFKNYDASVNPVLLFVQNETIIKSIPLTSSQLNVAVFPPGEYELRMLYDRNKNGKWDAGQFFGKHIQPEIVKPLSRRTINIKANWENEFDIAL